jgi:hypothetical protein
MNDHHQQLPYHITLHILRFIDVKTTNSIKPRKSTDSYGYFVRDPERKIVRIFDMYIDENTSRLYVFKNPNSKNVMYVKGAESIVVCVNADALHASTINKFAPLVKKVIAMLVTECTLNSQLHDFLSFTQSIRTKNVVYCMGICITEHMDMNTLERVLLLNHKQCSLAIKPVGVHIPPLQQLQIQKLFERMQPNRKLDVRVTMDIEFDETMPFFQESFWKHVGKFVQHLDIVFLNQNSRQNEMETFVEKSMFPHLGPRLKCVDLSCSLAKILAASNINVMLERITLRETRTTLVSTLIEMDLQTLIALGKLTKKLHVGSYYVKISGINVKYLRIGNVDGILYVEQYVTNVHGVVNNIQRGKDLTLEQFCNSLSAQ